MSRAIAEAPSPTSPVPPRVLARRLAPLLLCAAVVLALDQGSKSLVRSSLQQGRVVDLAGGWLRLDFTRNSGAAFGTLTSNGSLFAVVAVAVTLGLALSYRRAARSAATVRLGLGLVVGGALGNLLDRVRFGYVVDFIDLRWWYVFNIADSAIVVGVMLMLWHTIRSERSVSR